jgi:6-pyruvoyltetrahydropterin/6-carboxytetrahydropterin synthase
MLHVQPASSVGCRPIIHARLHGRNYESRSFAVADTRRWLRARLSRAFFALREFINATLDHKHLNDVFGHDRTTAEGISKWLYDWCKERWPEVAAIRVSETPRTWAEYRP